jgi:hypothetical protein
MGGRGETASIAQFVIGIDDRPCFCLAQENVDTFDNPIARQSVRIARGGASPAASIPSGNARDPKLKFRAVPQIKTKSQIISLGEVLPSPGRLT